MTQLDFGPIGNALQSLAALVVLLAILIQAGKHIQLLLSVGRLLEQLEARFNDHVNDRSIHPDAARLERLEEAVFPRA